MTLDMFSCSGDGVEEYCENDGVVFEQDGEIHDPDDLA